MVCKEFVEILNLKNTTFGHESTISEYLLKYYEMLYSLVSEMYFFKYNRTYSRCVKIFGTLSRKYF